MENKIFAKVIGILIVSSLSLNGCGSSILLDTPQSPIATETSPPTADLPLTLVPTVVTVRTEPPTEISLSFIGFDFETDTKNWHTSEGDYKLAETSVTTTIAHTGTQSLQITTELFGDQSPEFAQKNNDQVLLHTEATGYFDSSVPDGMDKPGPYDLTGKRVACFVYVPLGLAGTDSPAASVRIFVKDGKFGNQWGEVADITNAHIEQWFELSMVVGNDEGADVGFDPTQVNALGIRFDVLSGSKLSYSGPVFIDSCVIEYP